MQPVKLKKREISRLLKQFTPDTHSYHVFKSVAQHGRRTKQQLLDESPRPKCNPGREIINFVNPRLKTYGLAVYSTRQPGQAKPEFVLFSTGEGA